MSSHSFPIDAVYTWVDGSDPAWRQRKNAALAQLADPAGNEKTSSPLYESDTSECRFIDNHELLYSLRSLERFAPWIRTVHLVTDNQIPDWLDVSQVHLVSHHDIFPTDCPPVFNSSAIETVLYRIQDLSEHFLSFNDDFMLGRPAAPEDFFLPGGTPRIWFSQRSRSAPDASEEELKRMNPYSAGIARSRQLVRHRFKKDHRCRLRHTPKPMLISEFRAIWETFPIEMEQTMRSTFRSSMDLSIPMLNACFLLANETGVPRIINGIPQIFDALKGRIPHLGASLGDENFPMKCRLIRWLHPLTFCLNDSEKATDADRKHMTTLYEQLFPCKSRFEKKTATGSVA